MKVVVTEEIARPAEEVFAVVADMARNPAWQKGMVSCRWLDPEPHGVGSRYEQEARFLGRPIRSTFEVTAWEPPHRVAIRSVAGTFPIEVVRRVEAVGPDRSRVVAEVSGGPTGIGRLLHPLLAPLVRRNVAADYRRLRSLLEGSGTADADEAEDGRP